MKEFNVVQFSERIKSLRIEKGVGQNKMAEDLGLSNASISYWETGKQTPSAEVIFKMAVYFEVTADYLLGLNDW